MILFLFIVVAMLATGLLTWVINMAPIWWGMLIDAMAKAHVDESDWNRGRGQWF